MKPVIVVVGIKRSGTSLICQGLERLGVSFGSPLVEADKANIRGYYEHKDLTHYQTLLVQTCYDRRGWNGIGEFVELDGKVDYINAQLYEIEQVLLREMKDVEFQRKELQTEYDLFGMKLPLLQRIPSEWGSVFLEVGAEPIYIHAMRDPEAVYASTLKANSTEGKDTPNMYRQFLREWAWANAALFDYEPACEIWYSEWFWDPDTTMKKLADAIGKATVSTKRLLM